MCIFFLYEVKNERHEFKDQYNRKQIENITYTW